MPEEEEDDEEDIPPDDDTGEGNEEFTEKVFSRIADPPFSDTNTRTTANGVSVLDWWIHTYEMLPGQGTPFTPDNDREYERIFKVIVKRPVGIVTVCNSPGLPKPFAPYLTLDGLEDDHTALHIRMTGEPEYKDDWTSWIIRCKYSTKMPPGGPDFRMNFPNYQEGPQNHPELLPPVFDVDCETITIYPPFDRRGRPFITRAGQPYSPSVPVELDCPVLVMKRFELSGTTSDVGYWAKAINADPIFNAPAYCVLSLAPRFEQMYQGGVRCYHATRRFRFTPEPDEGEPPIPGRDTNRYTWIDLLETVLEQGTMQKPPLIAAIGGFAETQPIAPVPIMSPLGIPITQPVLLDEEGRKQTQRFTVGTSVGQLIPVYTKYYLHSKRIFSDLFENPEDL